MSFIRTTAVNKIKAMTKRKRVVDGGTSASKTFSIIAILISRASATPNLEISVISESVPHLRRGALKDFLKIMKSTGRYRSTGYNKSRLLYTFHNGSYIEFFSAQDEQGARRDILYVNEAIYIPFTIYHHYAVRTRKEIYLDYNPAHEFWVHEHLLGQSDVEHLTLTYLDNEGLEESIVNEIEAARDKAPTSLYWANWWKVYGLGQVGQLQGAVFSDYEIIKEYPKDCDYEYVGIDFGFSIDPAAVTLVGKKGNDIYLKELLYEKNLTNQQLADRIIEMGYKAYSMVGDSAEPKSIVELNMQGLNVYKAVKGADSIRAGIDKMHQFNLHVTEGSLNLIKELRNYTWSDKKAGVPIDAYNHCIDGIRYVIFKYFRYSGGFNSGMGLLPSSSGSDF